MILGEAQELKRPHPGRGTPVFHQDFLCSMPMAAWTQVSAHGDLCTGPVGDHRVPGRLQIRPRLPTGWHGHFKAAFLLKRGTLGAFPQGLYSLFLLSGRSMCWGPQDLGRNVGSEETPLGATDLAHLEGDGEPAPSGEPLE